ncbi:MAG: hypothetical protein R3B38_00360 [Patescibacteria group bacterium]
MTYGGIDLHTQALNMRTGIILNDEWGSSDDLKAFEMLCKAIQKERLVNMPMSPLGKESMPDPVLVALTGFSTLANVSTPVSGEDKDSIVELFDKLLVLDIDKY